ncbi:MAG: hypothetical protein ACREMR_00485 [Gemmatimonadales bacterium]
MSQQFALLALLLGAACRQPPALDYHGIASVAWGTPVAETGARLGQLLTLASSLVAPGRGRLGAPASQLIQA